MDGSASTSRPSSLALPHRLGRTFDGARASSIADYDAFIEPIRKRRMELSGWQVGDPAKAAQAMLKVALSDNLLAHLWPGSDAGAGR